MAGFTNIFVFLNGRTTEIQSIMLYKKKIAVVLSGCGVYDGVEIHEAVLTMLAIKRHNADYVLFAPDMD